jgi:hypothetical protein
MIEEFTKRWFERNHMVREAFEANMPTAYRDIVTAVVTMLHDEDEDGSIDPECIHEIDDGDYQGTLVYVIGASGYQPHDYWYVKVSYGSCSVCDTLQDILSGDYGHESEEEAQAWKKAAVDQLMTLALHIVQGLKKMGDTDD